MKRMIVWFSWVVGTAALGQDVGRPAMPAPLPEPERRGSVLRLVTWNILGGRGTDGSHPHDGLAEVIRILNPDAIALQEVDVKTTRARGVDLPAKLAGLTGLKSVFAEAMPFQGGSYGGAILTKLDVFREHRVALKAPAGSEPRVLLALELKASFLPRPMVFAGVHLEHQSDTVRVTQVEEMLAFFGGERRGLPAVIAGDFNASPSEASLDPLVRQWVMASKHPLATWPSSDPRQSIDHLLFRPAAHWRVLSVRRGEAVFPESPEWKARLQALSDHLPVVVEVAAVR